MKLLLIVLGIGFLLDLNVQAQKKLVCYYSTRSAFRAGNGRFKLEQIDPFLCTHLIVAFAGLDPVTFKMKALDDTSETGPYATINGLRLENPALKTLISIGGPNEGSEKYSKMAASPELRRTFIDSLVEFFKMPNLDFDGLDFHWDYPAHRGGKEYDKDNFVILLKELRKEFDKHGWLLSAAIGAEKEVVDTAYNVSELMRYLDFINVQTYDFHGPWEKQLGHHSPLNARPLEDEDHHYKTVSFSVNYLLYQGARRDQLILGMGLYGRSFTLVDSTETEPGSEAKGPGVAGPYTREPGILGYNEICEIRRRLKVVQDPSYQAPYAYYHNQWISYDDMDSLKRKCEFAKSLGLGGAMIWSIDTDDFRGLCHGQKYPLIHAIKEALNSEGVTTETATVPTPTTPSTIATTTSPRPIVTTTTSPRPIVTTTTSPRPIVTTTTSPRPIVTTTTSPRLIVTTTTSPRPVVTTTTSPRPIVTTTTSPRPIVTTTTSPRPIVTTTTSPRPIVTTTTSPRPIVTTTTSPRPIVTTTTSPRPIVTTTTKGPIGNEDCPSVGLHRDPYDCTKYYSCIEYHGHVIIMGKMQCPLPGLNFDNNLKICTWAQDVDCNN